MSNQRGPVVVGLDGSESAHHALRWAIDQALVEGRRLTLVHAATVSAAFGEASVANSDEVRALVRREGMAVLDNGRQLVAQVTSRLQVDGDYVDDTPIEALLRRSEEAAMIVVGTHGRGPLRSLLLGSVSVALVKHARCPVVVHRPGTSAGHTGGIVVATDARQDSRPVLAAAWRQADLRVQPVTVLHCVDEVAFTVPPEELPRARELSREQAASALAQAMAGLAEVYPDVVARTRVSTGPVRQALTDLRSEPELVVVGTHHTSVPRQLARGVGSTSVDVVEHAAWPVMVVPVAAPHRQPSRTRRGAAPQAATS